MEQYISKSALVAEIERRKEEYEEDYQKYGRPYHSVVRDEMENILSFIDTLEVKDVDLEEEMDKEWNRCEPIDEGMGLEIASIEHEQFDNIAKHFFEFGLNNRHEN